MSWAASQLGTWKGVKGLLRIDRKFPSHGPRQLKTAYKKRAAVERVFSRLKNRTSLTQHNLRGLAKITFHAQLCILIMLLTAQAVQQIEKPGQPNPTQPQRTSQSDLSFPTLYSNHASNSSSSHEHQQTKQSQKHQILRKLI